MAVVFALDPGLDVSVCKAYIRSFISSCNQPVQYVQGAFQVFAFTAAQS